jgi:dihydrofolate reductase
MPEHLTRQGITARPRPGWDDEQPVSRPVRHSWRVEVAMAERTGEVLWHLTMSLDGFIAGPNHEMGWMAGPDFTPGLVDRYVEGTGAILAGRRGFDAGIGGDPPPAPYGGAWIGPIFVLTHHPDDAAPHDGITFLGCDIAEAVKTGLGAAGGKDLEVFGADLARQCPERGLIDEFHVHLAPVMLGDGIRLLDAPGIDPVRWERIPDSDSGAQVLDLRYRPLWTTAVVCPVFPLATRQARCGPSRRAHSVRQLGAAAARQGHTGSEAQPALQLGDELLVVPGHVVEVDLVAQRLPVPQVEQDHDRLPDDLLRRGIGHVELGEEAFRRHHGHLGHGGTLLHRDGELACADRPYLDVEPDAHG